MKKVFVIVFSTVLSIVFSSICVANDFVICNKQTGQCYYYSPENSQSNEHWIDKARTGEVKSPQGLRIAGHLAFWTGTALVIGGIIEYAVLKDSVENAEERFDVESETNPIEEHKAAWLAPVLTGGIAMFAGIVCGVAYNVKKQELKKKNRYNLGFNVSPIDSGGNASVIVEF